MKREIQLDDSINEPKRKLKLLKTNLIFHTARPTFLTKVEDFLEKTIPPRKGYIDEKKEIHYLTKYLKDYNYEKELEERPPLYLYTSFLTKGIDTSINTLTTSYQSRNKSISRNQVSFYYLNQLNKNLSVKKKLEYKKRKTKLVKKEKFHRPGFIPEETYNLIDRHKTRNLVSEETPIEIFLKSDFRPVKRIIRNEYKKAKRLLNLEIDQEFTKPTEIIYDNFPENHRLISKYVKLVPPKEKDYEPKNNLYNIERIKKEYKIDEENMKKIIHKKKTINIPKIDKIFKWRKAIISAANQLKKLNMTTIPNEINISKIRPYMQPKSKEYFDSIKKNNIDNFLDLTFKNKLLLIDVDYSHDTILHLMAKRNIYLYISFALRNGANPNTKNYIGRTPLHLACEYNHNESIFVLLFEMADPLIEDNYHKTSFDLWKKDKETAKEYVIRTETIKRYNALREIHKYSIKSFPDCLRNGLLHLWNNDLELNFEPIKYGIELNIKR